MTSRNPNVRFCQNNQAAASGAVLTVSSSASGFPVANAVAAERWKRLVFAGAFEITAANKKVYINDGTDKTITLTEGTYVGGAALASHITTQLNAVSSSWGVSYTSGYLFSITRGGGGSKILRLSQTTDSVWDTLGFVGTVDAAASAADEIRVHTSEWIQVDLGAAKEILACFAIGQSGEEFSASEGATLTLVGDDIEANLDGTPTVSVTLTREAAGTFQFLDDLAATSLRYWRWKLVDRDNPNGPGFSVSQFYLGDYITTERNLSLGFSRQLVDPSRVTYSEAGAPFVARKTKYWVYSGLAMEHLIGEARTEMERLFDEIGTSVPFFVSLDPLAQISASVSEFTKYVMFTEVPSVDHIRHTRYQLSMTMREVVG